MPSCSSGFCVARTWKGLGTSCRVPATVTCCSCMACSSADCVRGEARLISSAISNCAKTGPGMNRKLRLPPGDSSSTSEPRMSEGIRSGVNWMRRASRPSTVPMVSTSFVLARPGTPTKSAWPPERIVISAYSTTCSCPKMTVPTAALAARACAAVVSAARTIMSSSFSRPSAPDFAMLVSLFFAPIAMQQTRHRRRGGQPSKSLAGSLIARSLRYFPGGGCSAVHDFATRHGPGG